MRVNALALFSLALSLGGVAEATELKTYKGVLGKIPIILEMSEPLEGGDREARYSYLNKGIDIPLHIAPPAGDGTLTVSEEEPCSLKHCKSIDDQEESDFQDVIPNPPIAAEWTMTLDKDETRFSGIWKDKKSGKTFPVSLTYIASRDDQADFVSANDLLSYGIDPGTGADDYPYDKLRFSVPMPKGKATTLNGGTYRLDEDKRMGAIYPAIETLPGGADTGAVNAWLLERRMNLYIQDYNCASQVYQGFRWSKMMEEALSSYKTQSSASVDFLSSRLIGVNEGGSFFCGGAHPDNFIRFQLGDVETGKSVAPEALVTGFVYQDFEGKPADPDHPDANNPATWVPGKEIIARVQKDRKKFDDTVESDCQYETLFESGLTVALRGENLVFTLKDLPNYAAACYDDVLTIPLAKAGDLLTDKGRDYLGEFLK